MMGESERPGTKRKCPVLLAVLLARQQLCSQESSSEEKESRRSLGCSHSYLPSREKQAPDTHYPSRSRAGEALVLEPGSSCSLSLSLSLPPSLSLSLSPSLTNSMCLAIALFPLPLHLYLYPISPSLLPSLLPSLPPFLISSDACFRYVPPSLHLMISLLYASISSLRVPYGGGMGTSVG